MDFVTILLLVLSVALILFGIGMSAWLKMFPHVPSSSSVSIQDMTDYLHSHPPDLSMQWKVKTTTTYREPAVNEGNDSTPEEIKSILASYEPSPKTINSIVNGPRIIKPPPDRHTMTCTMCKCEFDYDIKTDIYRPTNGIYFRVKCPCCPNECTVG